MKKTELLNSVRLSLSNICKNCNLEFDFLRSDKENGISHVVKPNRKGKINFSDSEKQMIIAKHLKALTSQVCINFKTDLQREMKSVGICPETFYKKLNKLN